MTTKKKASVKAAAAADEMQKALHGLSAEDCLSALAWLTVTVIREYAEARQIEYGKVLEHYFGYMRRQDPERVSTRRSPTCGFQRVH